MNITNACILAAGVGTRLAPLTDTTPKPLIPLVNKPMLDYMIEALIKNGITDILLIVGYQKEQIMEYYGSGEAFGIQISYIEQVEFLGTGDAANLAKDFSKNQPFLLAYGDLFVHQAAVHQIIHNYTENAHDGAILGQSVSDPTKFGILKLNSDGFLEKIIEKPPDDRYGNLINAGIYILPPDIFKSIANIPKSPRGEYELTDAISALIAQGKKFQVENISDYYWSDLGHPWQLLDATKSIMQQMPGHPVTKTECPDGKIINQGGIIEDFVTIHGTVQIGENTRIKSGTYIEGPVIIGNNCQIGPNSYLRPYSVIGNHCKIGNASEVKGSVIMDHSAIPHLSYVGDSIIGSHVNFGCGSITANLRLDKKNIKMDIKGTKIDSNRYKFGAIVGDHASLGIQVSIMPGKKIGAYAHIGSNTVVSKDVPSDNLLFTEQATQTRKRKK